jgi:hypothetical protein
MGVRNVCHLCIGEMYSISTIRTEFSETDIPRTGLYVQVMGLVQDLYEEPSIPYIEVLLLLVSCILSYLRSF